MKRLLIVALAAVMLLTGCSLGGSKKVGTGSVTTVAYSTSASEAGDGVLRLNVTYCSLVVDKKGKIESIFIDSSEPHISVDQTGDISSNRNQSFRTNKEMLEDYGLKKASSIGKEWYEQIEALEQWAVGKTVKEVLGMELSSNHAPSDPELVASCTIDVSLYLQAIRKAAEDALGASYFETTTK